MSLLRIIGTFVVFIFLGIFGFLVVLFKIISTIFSQAPKPAAPSSPGGVKSPSPSKKTANHEVIEVEVISVRKEEDHR
jgi:Na+-transporting methylmalonyl-CoA/oxaloacetate decarboxylase gamma subunit